MKVVFYSPGGMDWPSKDLVPELRVEFPGVKFHRAGSEEERDLQIREADVYCGPLSRDAFLAAGRLRWINAFGMGIEGLVNVKELVGSDVLVTNSPGPHADSIADHVCGMVLVLAHRLMEMFDDQRARRWEGLKYVGRLAELSGSTMGIFGLGRIGKAVATRAQGFGMDVYAVDKCPDTDFEAVNGAWGLDRLDELLAASDWFVVTVPFTQETQGLLDRRRVGMLKEGARVIVVSRGGILDEDALIDGLRSGRLGGAGLDAFTQEPLPADSPLWEMDNVVITPHCSVFTPRVQEVHKRNFKENLRRFIAGEPLLFVCDKKAGF